MTSAQAPVQPTSRESRLAASPYRPVATFWFGTIARLDPAIGVPMLQSADEAFELAALTEEIFLLAPNVLATETEWRGSVCLITYGAPA